MLTTTLPPSKILPTTAPRARATESIAVPRHLAVSMSANTDLDHLPTACAALRALGEISAARGVEFLTLVSHGKIAAAANGESLFERATAQITWRDFAGLKVRVLANADGRVELVEAARKLIQKARTGDLKPNAISASDVEHALHTPALPPVDFVLVLGSGEQLTGVLLWHCAYAEFLFQQKNWWEAARSDFEQAFADYARRCRKFGGLA